MWDGDAVGGFSVAFTTKRGRQRDVTRGPVRCGAGCRQLSFAAWEGESKESGCLGTCGEEAGCKTQP